MIELHAADIDLPEQDVGSGGPPQGLEISPLLFNIVMTRVSEAVSSFECIRPAIYADDIAHADLETRLQKAILAIDDRFDGAGLHCSPAK